MHLLLDIGGTNTRLATSLDRQSFSSPVKFPTDQDFDTALATLAKQVKANTPHPSYSSVIVGLPGVMDTSQDQLFSSPNLPNWVGRPITKRLTEITGSPVKIVNDSDLAGLGEAAYGVGQDYRIVAYLTISTGVGGTRIVNQKIDEAAFGFEPGFHIIDASGTLCPDCHHPSSLEDLIGGASTEQRLGRPPQDIDDPQLWDTYAQWLALGLHNITSLWSPDIIILGGPMMKDIPLNQVIQHTHQSLSRHIPHPPDIKLAALGDDRAFYGALALLNNDAK